MKALLPLPLTQITPLTHTHEQGVSDHSSVHAKELPSTSIQSGTLPSHASLLHMAESTECSDDGSPVKVSHRMRNNKKRHSLPDQDGPDSDSEESFLSLCKLHGAPEAKDEIKETLVSERVKRKPLTPEERVKSVLVSQCLESIADFLDNTSYMDSLHYPQEGDIHRKMLPACAAVKDGMTDEARIDTERGSWVWRERNLEIQAAAEALSFHKCQVSVAEAWDKAQQLEGELGKETAAELSLPVAHHRECYSFTQDSPCQPQ